jgi:hypothetical protein
MSLSINLIASNSATNLQHFHQPKPMAISSITSPTLPNTILVSESTSSDATSSSSTSSPSMPHEQQVKSPVSPTKRPSSPSYPVSVPSSPDSPDFFLKHPMNNFHLKRHHPYSYSQQPHHHHRASVDYSHYTTEAARNYTRPTRSSSISSVTSANGSSPLSLQERRQRNKAASAKYRAKKNQQHGEMRTLISSLSKENDLLQRQLDHVRRDNNRLKATCDRLRGKMLAEKMLKKLLSTDEQQEVLQEDEDEDEEEEEEEEDDIMMTMTNNNSDSRMYLGEESYFINSKSQIQIKQLSKRFDEDIEFEDEEEEEKETQFYGSNSSSSNWDQNSRRQQSQINDDNSQ